MRWSNEFYFSKNCDQITPREKKKPSKICLSPNVWFITLLVVVFNLCPRGMGWTLIEPDLFGLLFCLDCSSPARIISLVQGIYGTEKQINED